MEIFLPEATLRRMRSGRVALSGLLVLLIVGIATYLAGEQVEVAVLRTVDSEGVAIDTKMWIVDYDGVPWVRVANPNRQWFKRLSRQPRAGLIRHGSLTPVIARAQTGPDAQAILDRRFREKYGAVDWWYGALLRRGAIPLRLDPAPEAP